MWNDRPKLSVVVAASHSAGAVARCLVPILAEARAGDIELIVAAPAGLVDEQALPRGVLCVAAKPGAGVGRLRYMGLRVARAPVVAFTEDSCRLGQGWPQALIQAFSATGVVAATGPVRNAACRSALDWAVFFCEYAPFLERASAGAATRLAGNNFAARRSLLEAACRDGGLEEWRVQRLAAQRGKAVFVPAASLWHVRSYCAREAILGRLRGGWQFGRADAQCARGVRAILKLLAGPGILVAQLVRLLTYVLPLPAYAQPFWESLPVTLALLCAWSVGEWLGRWAAALRWRASRSSRETAVQTVAQAPGPQHTRRAGYTTARARV